MKIKTIFIVTMGILLFNAGNVDAKYLDKKFDKPVVEIKMTENLKVNKKYVKNKLFKVESKNLNLIFDDVAVTIKKSNSDKIKVTYDSNEYKFDLNKNNLKFTVSGSNNDNTLFFGRNFSDIIVEIPKNIYNKINIDSKNSDIYLKNYKGNMLDLDLKSTDIYLNNVNFKYIDLKSKDSSIEMKLDKKIITSKLKFDDEDLLDYEKNNYILEDNGVKIVLNYDEDSSVEIK